MASHGEGSARGKPGFFCDDALREYLRKYSAVVPVFKPCPIEPVENVTSTDLSQFII